MGIIVLPAVGKGARGLVAANCAFAPLEEIYDPRLLEARAG
jgi:hypothetical protein